MSEEAFYRSVIQTISLSRHTLRYAELFEFLNVQRMRVMHALIKQVADIGRISFSCVKIGCFSRLNGVNRLRQGSTPLEVEQT